MSQKQILIVDDEEDVLTMLEKRLSKEGYSVSTATSAKTLAILLDIEKPNLPDLIILDIGLPDLDGREIADRLRHLSITQKIPIIFLTALYSKQDEIRLEGMLNGCRMFTKPYEKEDLIRVVQESVTPEENLV